MRWTKSSFCADKACVEAASAGGRVLVRDSKDPGGQMLEFDRAAWYGFLEAIRTGELDDL